MAQSLRQSQSIIYIVRCLPPTPYDTWDYDGVNELALADLDINGKKTPVALKADRNGFFYVLNRQTGTLISAQPFVTAILRPAARSRCQRNGRARRLGERHLPEPV